MNLLEQIKTLENQLNIASRLCDDISRMPLTEMSIPREASEKFEQCRLYLEQLVSDFKNAQYTIGLESYARYHFQERYYVAQEETISHHSIASGRMDGPCRKKNRRELIYIFKVLRE